MRDTDYAEFAEIVIGYTSVIKKKLKYLWSLLFFFIIFCTYVFIYEKVQLRLESTFTTWLELVLFFATISRLKLSKSNYFTFHNF